MPMISIVDRYLRNKPSSHHNSTGVNKSIELHSSEINVSWHLGMVVVGLHKWRHDSQPIYHGILAYQATPN